MHAFPEVRFRYVVSPKKSLPSTRSPLKFNKKKIQKMMKIGYDDAVDAIHEGEGVTVTHLLDWYEMKRRGKAQTYRDFGQFVTEKQEKMMQKQ